MVTTCVRKRKQFKKEKNNSEICEINWQQLPNTGKLVKYLLHSLWSLSFCPIQSIHLPECRPEGCLSSHSETRGCTLTCTYSAPANNIYFKRVLCTMWSQFDGLPRCKVMCSLLSLPDHSRPSAASRWCHPSPDPPLSLWTPGWRTRSKASSTCWNQSAATHKVSARALS